MSNVQTFSEPLYLQHFGLQTSPFRLTPAIDCFFDGGERGELLNAVAYALLHGDGIVAITGEVGTGKTTLSRVLMKRGARCLKFIYIANPSIDRQELHLAVAQELGLRDAVPGPGLLRAVQHRLIGLHARGRQAVLLVDEAHEMPRETLQELRLLSNLETSVQKLLQVVLVGQPELDTVLLQPALRPLRERIAHRFVMPVLDDRLARQYLAFRLRRAGGSPLLFTPAAITLMTERTGGLARRMNILADKCLLAAFAEPADQVDVRHVHAALADVAFPYDGLPAHRSLRAAAQAWLVRRLPASKTRH